MVAYPPFLKTKLGNLLLRLLSFFLHGVIERQRQAYCSIQDESLLRCIASSSSSGSMRAGIGRERAFFITPSRV